MLETKTKPIVDTPVELLIHIIKRDDSGEMEDKTLCGKLWDRPVVSSKNICSECKEIAERKGYKWSM